MKTMNAILATITIGASSLLSAGNAYAGDEMNVTPMKAEKKATFVLKSPKSIDVSVFVTNRAGDILFEETIKSQKSYGRVYDFTNLNDGVYTIVSDDNYIKTTTDVSVNHSAVQVLRNDLEYKPIFQKKGNSLMVNHLNIDAKEIKFTIEDGNSVLYQSDEGNKISFQKKLDISKMVPGDYYATVEVGRKSYSYSFYIR